MTRNQKQDPMSWILQRLWEPSPNWMKWIVGPLFLLSVPAKIAWEIAPAEVRNRIAVSVFGRPRDFTKPELVSLGAARLAMPPICAAARGGDVELMKTLLRELEAQYPSDSERSTIINQSVQTIDQERGYTALHYAARGERPQCAAMMKLLVDIPCAECLRRDDVALVGTGKIDGRIVIEGGTTPLHQAVLYDQVEAVNYLLSREEVVLGINEVDNEGRTAIEYQGIRDGPDPLSTATRDARDSIRKALIAQKAVTGDHHRRRGL